MKPIELPQPLSHLRVIMRVRREIRIAVLALRRAGEMSKELDCNGVFLAALFNEHADLIEREKP